MKRLAIALLALVALSACVGELPADPPIDVDPNPPPAQDPEVSVEYVDGAWNYTVEANVPTPCHGLVADGLVAESYPEQISLTITVTEPSGNEACQQVVDRTSVEGTVEASEYASMTITFEGERIYEHEAQVPPSQRPPGDELACPAIYDPVCGQPPMPPCPEGFGCIDVMPQPRTYGNRCELSRTGAAFLYEGECDLQSPGDELACPAIYDPVCGQPLMPECPPGFACPTVMPQPRTYGNGCELSRTGAAFLYEGECRDDLIAS